MCIDNHISYTVYIISSYIITWIPCWVSFSGGSGSHYSSDSLTLDDTPQSFLALNS